MGCAHLTLDGMHQLTIGIDAVVLALFSCSTQCLGGILYAGVVRLGAYAL